MKIPKGYRQREAAAAARRRQRIVSEDVREQRAKFLAQSAGLVEEVVVPVEPVVPVPEVPVTGDENKDEQPTNDADETAGETESTEGEGEAAQPDAEEPVAEPVKNKGGRPKKQA